jgi:hypothetical protein
MKDLDAAQGGQTAAHLLLGMAGARAQCACGGRAEVEPLLPAPGRRACGPERSDRAGLAELDDKLQIPVRAYRFVRERPDGRRARCRILRSGARRGEHQEGEGKRKQNSRETSAAHRMDHLVLQHSTIT